MSMWPVKTRPEVYAAVIASRLTWSRGAGVRPPSGESRVLRELHGSNWVGSAQLGGLNGQPSGTIWLAGFQLPTLAFRSRNSAGVSSPLVNAVRPYCTPTL